MFGRNLTHGVWGIANKGEGFDAAGGHAEIGRKDFFEMASTRLL